MFKILSYRAGGIGVRRQMEFRQEVGQVPTSCRGVIVGLWIGLTAKSPAGPSGSGPRPPPDGRPPWTAGAGRASCPPGMPPASSVESVTPAPARLADRRAGVLPATLPPVLPANRPEASAATICAEMVTAWALPSMPGTSPATARPSAWPTATTPTAAACPPADMPGYSSTTWARCDRAFP